MKVARRYELVRVKIAQRIGELRVYYGAPRPVHPDLASCVIRDCEIDPAPHVVADARLVSDKILETEGHVGAHSKFLRMISRDNKFPTFIRGIRDQINAVQSSGNFSWASAHHRVLPR